MNEVSDHARCIFFLRQKGFSQRSRMIFNRNVLHKEKEKNANSAFFPKSLKKKNEFGSFLNGISLLSVVFYLYRGQGKSLHLFTALWRISVYFHIFSKDRLSSPVYGE